MSSLSDHTALVTGATSGIGRAIALELARDGAHVIVSGRDAGRGEQTVAAIEAEGGSAAFVAADLGDLSSVARLAEAAAGADVLVNNAGVFTFAPTGEQDVAGFEAMFDVNVRGTFFLTAALAPRMAERGRGSIVNVSTMVAEIGMAGAAAYSASKAAINALTRAWAVEWGAAGVRVNAVSPGPTRTEGTDPEMAGALGATTPLGRSAAPDEIAQAVAFLASPRASYVTGAIVPADGGRVAV